MDGAPHLQYQPLTLSVVKDYGGKGKEGPQEIGGLTWEGD